jgi:saccharopine dehydrogenase (NAD+, L-lysine-forming)
MTKTKMLYIRKETNINEHRTPIIPNDISILLNEGFIVYIEASTNRIYKNEEYITEGAILTHKKWYDPLFKNGYIVGIKAFDNIQNLDNHNHIYFSHSYKNQSGSMEILREFAKKKSLIYDFEFFLDKQNKRLISFGFYAGLVGGFLGLLQNLEKKMNQKNISSLSSSTFDVEKIKNKIKHDLKFFGNLKIAIVGKGKCGQGVASVLNMFGIAMDWFGREDNKSILNTYDIVYNCINLSVASNEIWFSDTTDFSKKITIVDISCDCTKSNNPIAIYNTETSWETPVFSYNEFVDIIAIDNLPTLLPKESSNYFSNKFVELLINMEYETWKKNEQIFYQQISSVS